MKILTTSICPPRTRYRTVAWVGLAVTVAGTAASIAQQRSAAKKAQAGQDAAMKGLNAGGKPKAAEYTPVDFDDEQLNTILGNIRGLGSSEELVKGNNAIIDRDAMNRAVHFIPNYRENMRLEGQNANNLLNGRLPYDDVLGVVSDRSQLANSLGTPGGAGPATFRDLGLKQLDGINQGAGLMQQMVQIAEAINPVSRRSRPQDMQLSPLDRIRAGMEQNQLIQQSTQSKYNLEAGISPTEMGRQQLQLANSLTPQPQIDYAGLASGVAMQALGAYKAGGAGGAGGYDMATDPQLYRGTTGTYYTRPTGGPGYTIPNLSDRPYSIAA